VPVRAFALVVAIVALVSACGDGGGDPHAEHLYNAYRTAEDQRTEAESRLRQAFSDISLAASQEDRAGVLAAANRGRDAAAEIDRLFSAELEAANGLSRIETVAAEGKRLAKGIELTRHGLDLEAKELDIALKDPFLATRADARTAQLRPRSVSSRERISWQRQASARSARRGRSRSRAASS